MWQQLVPVSVEKLSLLHWKVLAASEFSGRFMFWGENSLGSLPLCRGDKSYLTPQREKACRSSRRNSLKKNKLFFLILKRDSLEE